MRINKKQSLLLALGTLASFFIISTILLKSQQSKISVAKNLEQGTTTLSEEAAHAAVTPTPANASASPTPELVAKASTGSTVNLQKFHRIETKNGRKIWEATGSAAEIKTDQNIATINDAQFIFYRPQNDTVKVYGDKATLNIIGGELQTALLEKNVRVVLNKDQTLTTESATYDQQAETISAPDSVSFEGPVFNLTGSNLLIHTDTQEFTLRRNVKSTIKPKVK